jgi:hypothetical protein
MANEITITSGIQIIKGNLNRTINTESVQADFAGVRVNVTTQAVGTTYEAYAAGDLASAGWARFKNLDATNYVELGVEVSAAFHPLVRIDAGKIAGPFRLSTLSFFLRANTAAVNVECLVSEA